MTDALQAGILLMALLRTSPTERAKRVTGEPTCPFGPTEFVLFLHGIPHLGEKTLAHLLRLHGQHRLVPDTFRTLSALELQRQYAIPPAAAAHMAGFPTATIARTAEIAKTLRHQSIQVLTAQSATFPWRLEAFDDAPPPVLYALGNLAVLDGPSAPPEARFTFTCAASNGAPANSLARQDEIANALVEAGGAPVTGHDRPPYQRLALSAQRQNRSVCYVFDRGLREALGPEFDRPPFAAARIRDAAFDRSRDLALSPFRLDDHSLGANNRRRDRLIFALADVIIGIDVRSGGGMEAECLRAHRLGQGVFIAPGGREGNTALITAGCRPLPDEPGWAFRIAENTATQGNGKGGSHAG